MQTKRTLAPAIVLLGILLMGAVPQRCHEPTITDHAWLAEAQFLDNPLLHATPDQVIVFNLESARQSGRLRADKPSGHHGRSPGRRLIRNTAAFLIRDTDPQMFSFCVAEDDPHVAVVELEAAAGQSVWRHRPGEECAPAALPAGRYRLHVFHDPGSVVGDGRKLFLHRPRARLFRPVQVEAPDKVGSALPNAPDFIAFMGPNGYFVSDYSSPDGALTCDSDGAVYPSEVWRLAPYPNSPSYTFKDGYGSTVTEALFTDPAEFYADDEGQSGYVVPRFQFNDKGNWNFTLTAWWDPVHNVTSQAGVIVDEFNAVVGDNTVPATVFTAKYQGFTCPSTCNDNTLPLQKGEIALFSKNDYQGDAVVALTNVENFADYNASGSAQTQMASIRVGPGTYVILYTGGHFDGDSVGISIDTPSLSGTPVGSQGIMSWQIFTNAKHYILKSDTCVSCNLEGIDLSNVDLSSGVFTGSDFTDANLSGTDFTQADLGQTVLTGATLNNADFARASLVNATLEKSDLNAANFTSANLTGATFRTAVLADTIFQSANLTRATFSGATPYEGMNFSNANLACTSFGGSSQAAPWDLTGAVFDADPEITEDFSCRLSLKNTALNATTFTPDIWRYLDLDGATINNDTGGGPLVLSSVDDPLDLSGAILSGVTGLAGVVLDGANLGCATPEAADKHCTQLIDTSLTRASLVQANLVDAALNGAKLIQVNLEKADLSGAQMLKSPITSESTELSGAYLKNANLAMADLSGAALKNVNWFSPSPVACNPGTWTGACASGEGATLSNADLEGAYLNGLDLSDAILQGVNLSDAQLVGARFTRADLSRDSTTGAPTSLSGAFLQGADFTDATSTGVDFLSAYVDLSSSTGASIVFQLPRANLEFEGYANDPADPECVLFSYTKPTTLPGTDSTNTCPDGDDGSCTDARWQMPTTPIDQAQPPSGIGFSPVGTCTAIDFTW